jgi:hypothetical protein
LANTSPLAQPAQVRVSPRLLVSSSPRLLVSSSPRLLVSSFHLLKRVAIFWQ